MNVAELRSQLAALSGPTSPSYVSVLKHLRKADLPRLSNEDAAVLVVDLAALDPNWSVRLHLLFDDAGPEGTPIASRLRAAIVRQARDAIGLANGDVAELDLRIREVSRLTPSPPLGVWIAALWHDISEESFAELSLEVLRRLMKYDWTLGPEPSDDLKRRHRYVAAVVSSGFEPPQTVRGALTLARSQAVLAARARSHVKQMNEQVDALDERNKALAAERRGLAEANGSLSVTNAKLLTQVEELEQKVVELEAIARHDAASAATRGQTQVSRTKERVLDVLEREVGELRRYLDRAEPNIEGALSRLVHLERLGKWVREEA